MFNPMERIRKLAGFPPMVKGYPPATHRKCSDWAKYHDATDTVTRELVAMLLQCQATGLATATDKAAIAGELATFHDRYANSEKQRGIAAVDRVLIEDGSATPDIRKQVAQAINGDRMVKGLGSGKAG